MAFPESAPMIREATLERIARNHKGLVTIETLASALRELPPGSFKEPSPLLLALLKDPLRRSWMEGMIPRLADGGAKAAPLLMRVLADSADAATREASVDDAAAAVAAIEGLCVIGPAAPPSFRQVEAIVARHRELKRRFPESNQRWAVFRARLGRPLSTIGTGQDFSDHWWRDVRERVDAGECQRD